MTGLLWLLGGIIVACFGLIVLRGAPYVPTHRRQLNVAFTELYPLKATDTLVDLGSGDGVVLAAAASHGARAIGYELNPFLVGFSRWRLRQHKTVKVLSKDFLNLKALPEGTTVVYAFTTGHSIEQIGHRLEQWAAGQPLYFISYGFRLKSRPVLASRGAMHLYRFE